MRAGDSDRENNPDSKDGCNVNRYGCSVSCCKVSAVVQHIPHTPLLGHIGLLVTHGLMMSEGAFCRSVIEVRIWILNSSISSLANNRFLAMPTEDGLNILT